MTGRSATMSIDGTPVSRADTGRIEKEERLHADRQRRAARTVAAASHDVDDCRLLLDILGLDHETVLAARKQHAAGSGRGAAGNGSRAA